jgi:hypothetical protein
MAMISTPRTLRLSLVALVLSSPFTLALASEGGGGSGGDDRWAQPVQANRAAPPAAGAARRPGPIASARSTLPDGTRITSEDVGGGVRSVRTLTPDGNMVQGRRGDGAARHKANRTVYNPKTGITSTFTRGPDGRVTGVHVDRQGNRSVSRSNN